jgi:hypothetical protein
MDTHRSTLCRRHPREAAGLRGRVESVVWNELANSRSDAGTGRHDAPGSQLLDSRRDNEERAAWACGSTRSISVTTGPEQRQNENLKAPRLQRVELDQPNQPLAAFCPEVEGGALEAMFPAIELYTALMTSGLGLAPACCIASSRNFPARIRRMANTSSFALMIGSKIEGIDA